MKKLICLLFVAVYSLSFLSCDKDPEIKVVIAHDTIRVVEGGRIDTVRVTDTIRSFDIIKITVKEDGSLDTVVIKDTTKVKDTVIIRDTIYGADGDTVIIRDTVRIIVGDGQVDTVLIRDTVSIRDTVYINYLDNLDDSDDPDGYRRYNTDRSFKSRTVGLYRQDYIDRLDTRPVIPSNPGILIFNRLPESPNMIRQSKGSIATYHYRRKITGWLPSYYYNINGTYYEDFFNEVDICKEFTPEGTLIYTYAVGTGSDYFNIPFDFEYRLETQCSGGWTSGELEGSANQSATWFTDKDKFLEYIRKHIYYREVVQLDIRPRAGAVYAQIVYFTSTSMKYANIGYGDITSDLYTRFSTKNGTIYTQDDPWEEFIKSK